MSVYTLDPLCDPRWLDFLQRRSLASVFHTPGWMRALQSTYGYEPVVYTTSPPGTELLNGWVFCRVKSWLTGSRLVSLPFSDHCEPLVDEPEHLEEISRTLRREEEKNSWRYIEYRPVTSQSIPEHFERSEVFCFHKLSLRPDLNNLLRGVHQDSVQRRIEHAKRQGLICEEGNSDLQLGKFYHLMVLTRRRHGLPPQPRVWFSNLISHMGEQVKIRIASSKGVPVAAILTISFKNTLVYKYGCADARHFHLGAMQLLLWQAIEEAKGHHLQEFDLGRSGMQDKGLIVFKNRWGATPTTITYFRYSNASRRQNWNVKFSRQAKAFASYVPVPCFTALGKFYKHFG
jgi:hypothetical protein